MRVGIIGLLHESNTFSPRGTSLDDFRQLNLLTGDEVSQHFAASNHELGGFFAGLESHADLEAVPLFAARALPSGMIDGDSWQQLVTMLQEQVDQAGRLDGYLIAPHGATVSEHHPDADGHWLTLLRDQVGSATPIISTIDSHANVSPQMVAACDAMVAYRSNPHLDQKLRGREAADLIARTLHGEIRPVTAASFPPLAVNIERQMTEEPHWRPLFELADQQLQRAGILANSIVLGFPYADVHEMGSSIIAVADGDRQLARSAAVELATALWNQRDDFRAALITIEAAIEQAASLEGPVCLLDMGDNVGGGSPADSTWLAHALHTQAAGKSLVCLFDPGSVGKAESAGIGATLSLSVGGHTDQLHGEPLSATFRVVGLFDGKFRESQVRHGGFTDFDQGRTAIVEADSGLTCMLTSRRMVPFSLQQLISCDLNPTDFQFLVAKGVNAPVAAYREVCPHLIRVDTPGCTTANMQRLTFRQRRQPLFPFELDTAWTPE